MKNAITSDEAKQISGKEEPKQGNPMKNQQVRGRLRFGQIS